MGQEKYTAYKNEFIQNHYDRINLVVKKGQKKVITEFAKERGESLNQFINRDIQEAMKKETQ